jgi:hypothetical protein
VDSKYVVAAAALLLTACSDAGQAQSSVAHELVLYRPSNSTFYIRRDGAAARELPFGTPGDVGLWGDFDGSGRGEPALYRKGQWLISTHADGKADLTLSFGGQPGEIALAADMDGDRKTDLIVFRSGEWDVRGTRNPAVTQILHFGAAGDLPVLADADGDGKVDLIVFRAGQWLVDTQRDGKTDLTFAFGGVAGERPLVANLQAGRPAALVLFRDGEWLVSEQRDGKVTDRFGFGASGDIPLALRATK